MLAFLGNILESIKAFFLWVYQSITDFFNSVIDFLDWLITFGSSTVYDWVVWAYAALVEWLTLWMLQTKVASLRFAWSVGRQIVADMGFGGHLATAWAFLPADLAGYLSIARVPECISIIVTAYVTRFALRFIPRF